MNVSAMGHAQLAVARLSMTGMTSWAMFNAYHAALLNAKSIMALLGVVFPKIKGGDFLIDLYPVPDKRRNNRQWKMTSPYNSFLPAKFSKLEQRYVWLALQRCCKVTIGAWHDQAAAALGRINGLNWEAVTPPRNRFLYSASFWPELDDLLTDIQDQDWSRLVADSLDPEQVGFLLSLSLDVCALANWLFADIASASNLLRNILVKSRWPMDAAEQQWGALQAYEMRFGEPNGAGTARA